MARARVGPDFQQLLRAFGNGRIIFQLQMDCDGIRQRLFGARVVLENPAVQLGGLGEFLQKL